MTSGGYKKPANPAPVSLPGSLSQRTDGGPTQPATYMPGLPYGTGGENMSNQTSAPLAGNPTAAVAVASPVADMTPIATFSDPTAFPDRPMTYGADAGAGPDSSILNLPAMSTPQVETPIQIVQALYMLDPTNQDLRFVLEGLSNQGRLQMANFPKIKLDANGLPVMVGVEERTTTQSQADYTDLQKSMSLVTGIDGYNARKMFAQNPEASAGLITGLAQQGALATNPIITTLAQIDKMTQDKRKADAIIASNKISTDKFNNTALGSLWSGLKGLSRGAAVAGNTVVEVLTAPLRSAIDEFNQIKTEGSWQDSFKWGGATGQTKPADILKSIPGQLTTFQVAKQLVQDGKVDLGVGFFPNEETGAAAAARAEQIKLAKVSFQQGGQTYYRPYSLFDPAAFVITGGHPESAAARVITAIGEVGLSVAADPFLAYSRLAKAANEAKIISESATGIKAAKAAKQYSLLESQLKAVKAKTEASLTSLNGAKTAIQKEKYTESYLKNFQNLARIEDEFKNIKIDYDGISTFLSGEKASHIIDAIANEDSWIKIQKMAKGKFTADEAVALSKANSREEVLRTIAPFIADGEPLQRALENGTKTGRALKGISESAANSAAGRALADSFETVLPKGDRIRAMNAIRGASAQAFTRMPLHENILKLSNEVHAFGRKYNAFLPQAGGTLIHLDNKDELLTAVNNVGRFMKLDKVVLDDIMTEIATATDKSKAGITATSKLFNKVFEKYAPDFTDDQLKLWKEATRVFETERLNMSAYWAEQHAKGADITFAVIGGEKINLHSAHLDSELLNTFVFIPDPKAMQDFITTSKKFAGLKLGKGVVLTENLLSDINSLWKKSVLVRPAYISRNIIEEQIRVFGTGHISFLNHPLSAMAMWIGRPGGPKWKEFLNQLDSVRDNVYGKSFKMGSSAEEFASAEIAGDLGNDYVAFMSDAMSGMGGDGEMSKIVKSLGYSKEVFGHPNWWAGFSSQVRILHNSEFVRKVIATKPGKELDTVNYFLKGEGRKTLDRFSASKAESFKNWVNTESGLMDFLFKGVNDKGQQVSVLARVEEMAGRGSGSQLIKQLLANGEVKVGNALIKIPTGKDIAKATLEAQNKGLKGKRVKIDLHKDFTSQLEETFASTGNWDGILMTVPKTAVVGGKALRPNWVEEITQKFFDVAVKFEKTSTMGPEWRQSYWDAIHNLSGSLNTKALNELRGNAPKSLSSLRNPVTGAPIGQQHKAWRALEVADGTGPLNLDEAHQYAVKYANKSVENLFYDASKRNLLWHQLRLVAPFGQAWEDTMKAWGKIALDNPTALYKVGKVGDWLSGPESSALYELTDARDYYDPNQGFFFGDPLTGERKFFVPFASSAMNALQGMMPGASASRISGPYALSAQPQSFNFALGAGTFLPGAGFGLLWGVAALDALNKNPLKLLPTQLEEYVFKVAFPYGTPDIKNAGLLEGPLLSSNWVRALGGAFGVESSFAAAFAPSMNYLASSGEYDLLDPDDQARLTQDGQNLARYFTMWRGLFGALTPIPFALRPEALAKNKNGDTVLAVALWNNFKSIESAAGGDKPKAYVDFLDTYGPEQVFAIIKSTTGYEPTNLPTYNMIKNDPTVVQKYADVYGYLYPNGELSKVLYQYQKERGAFGRMSAKEIMDKAVNILYTASKERLMTRSVGEGWTSTQYQDALTDLTKSYNLSGRVQPEYDTQWRERAFAQIRLASEDPKLADSSALIAARAYLDLREEAIAASGMKTLANKASAPQRAWLSSEALRLITKYPDFQKIFYGVFKKELEG